MGYPTVETIVAEAAAWEFIHELPATLHGFTKNIMLKQQGQLLFICAYINESLRARVDIIYTTETFDYLLRRKMGLNEYRDIRFIFKDRAQFEKEVAGHLAGIIEEMADYHVRQLGYMVDDKGILTWEYGNSLPQRLGDFELYIKPAAAMNYINGSVIFLDYSNFARGDQLVFLYNCLRNELFAEIKIGGVFKSSHTFDCQNLQELEGKLKTELAPTLTAISAADHEI
ncbi:MAG: hypothetical protein RR384_07435 [Acidaminococcaceae bacterium]